MTRQVRISDENARRLEDQGGSLSAAADRTLAWALDLIDNAPDDAFVDAQPVDDTPGPVDEPVDRQPPAPRRLMSSQTGRGRRFAVQLRRQW